MIAQIGEGIGGIALQPDAVETGLGNRTGFGRRIDNAFLCRRITGNTVIEQCRVDRGVTVSLDLDTRLHGIAILMRVSQCRTAEGQGSSCRDYQIVLPALCHVFISRRYGV